MNTASRMASTAPCSLPGSITLHTSESTVNSLPPDFLERLRTVYNLTLSKRGDGMDIKGKVPLSSLLLLPPL